MKKIVKNFTKLVSVIAAISLILSSAVTAFAADEWTKYAPCSELSIPQDVLGSEIICAKTTKHGPAVIWSPEELSEEAQTDVWDSLKGLPGVGNPKGVLYISGETSCEYGMTVIPSEGRVVFDYPSNWALIYAGSFLHTEDPEITEDPEVQEEPEEEPEIQEEPEEEPREEIEISEEPEEKTEIKEELDKEIEIPEIPEEIEAPAEEQPELPEQIEGIFNGGQSIPDYIPEEAPEVIPEPVPQPDIEPDDYVMMLDPAPDPVYDGATVKMIMAEPDEIILMAEPDEIIMQPIAETRVLDIQPKTGADDGFGMTRKSILPIRYYVCLAAAAAAFSGLIAAAIFICGKKEWKNVK